MFNILFVEIRESASAGSFILVFYLLTYSGNYIIAPEKEKFFHKVDCKDFINLIKVLTTLLNRIDCDDEDLYVVYKGNQKNVIDYLSLANEDCYVQRDFSKINIRSLNEYLGTDLYTWYCSNFDFTQSITYLNMLDYAISFNVKSEITRRYAITKSILCFYVTKSSVNKYLISVCLFNLSSMSRIDVVAHRNFQYILNGDSDYYNANLIMSKIRGLVASHGVSKDDLIILFCTSAHLKALKSFEKECNLDSVGFTNNAIVLTDTLSDVTYLDMSTYTSMIRYLSHSYAIRQQSALDLVESLAESSEYLGLSITNDRLSCNNKKFIKDFSSDVFPADKHIGVKYGIILDCEGTVENGCTELGGIIFGQFGNNLCKLRTFSYTDIDIIDGIEEVLSSYEELSGRYIPQRGIDVLVYGGNDEKMVTAALSGNAKKSLRRKVSKLLNFMDCRPYVYDYIDDNNIEIENRKLGTVANTLSVEVVRPKHSALNDAKTLFNILAKILLVEDNFII